MSIAGQHLAQANGWGQFNQATEEDLEANNADHLEISHKIARLYQSKAGKEVLEMLVERFLLADIALPTDTQIGIGIKQGRASVVKEILAHIEISNNSK